MDKVELAMSPLAWTNDDLPSLGGHIPLSECLSGIARAGFKGTELGVKYPRKASLLQPLLGQYQLRLASGWYSLKLLERSVTEEISSLKRHLELLKGCGCQVVVVGETSRRIYCNRDYPLSERPCLSHCEWSHYGDKLTKIAEYIKSEGLALAFHHHMGTICQSLQDIESLFQYTDACVGFTLDTAHLAYAGVEPEVAIRALGSRIKHVHCKDINSDILADAKSRELSFLDAVINGVFTVPGRGELNWLSILIALKNQGYKGWLVVEVEQDPAVVNPQQSAEFAFSYLSEQVAKAGFA